MAIAQAIEIDMPHDFPTAAHNAVSAKLPYQPDNPSLWAEYADGWRAVAIRFKTAAGADKLFTASISKSSAPPPNERQIQEEALFTFFVTGYAAVESFAYALFALGAMLRPESFPMSTPRDLERITPTVTRQKFAAHFFGTTAEAKFSAVATDSAYWSVLGER